MRRDDPCRAPRGRRAAWLALVLAAVTLVGISPGGAAAATRVTLSGSGLAGPLTPDADGSFSFSDVPLRRNAVNLFTVTATDDFGNSLSREVRITQLSLESLVVSRVTAEPLTVQQVQQLVADGVIKLDDPENFNVSQFSIVLTIGQEPVPISLPIVIPKSEETGYEVYRLPPSGPDSGGKPRIEPVEIVVFEQPVPAVPGLPPPPRIPGVIVIDGRIKTLKEFYSVRLLLLNTSGIFTLKDVKALVEFPAGGLSSTLPADGIVSFGDILPGTPEQPGQGEREFIIRGDEIGVRPVLVSFGGFVGGPLIPDDQQIPFNGSATATVEVKGPPTFLVQVTHPPGVVAGVPYELIVSISNTGETPALYASLELDVGVDADLVDCLLDGGGAPVCEPIRGAAVRQFGHIFPGATVSETFTVLPFVTGTVTSCMGVADQNITLQVHVGAVGCLVGRFPPTQGTPGNLPTVNVLPSANALAVSIDSPVVAFFSKEMNTGTITQGAAGSFRVIDDRGQTPPGRLRFDTLNGRTVAVWQLEDGVTNRLRPDAEYTVQISQDIRDLAGHTLANAWQSRFTTTNPVNDQDPPTLTLSVEPPVNPNLVLPGQIIRLNAYASDQGSGVARVELRRQDAGAPDAPFELVDQKTVFETTSGPCIFTVDSTRLEPGRSYHFKATAYDKMGNAQDATLAVILAPSAAPPTIRMPDDPAQPVPQGLFVTLRPQEVSASVKSVDYYLDGALSPIRTMTLPPFQTSLGTLDLPPGSHTVRAVAMDGLGQTGQDDFGFVVAANGARPQVDFGSAVDGAVYTLGSVFPVVGNATDPVGIQSVAFYLDAVGGTLLATGTAPFLVNTAGLAPGAHRLIIVATNKLGLTNDLGADASILDFSVVTAQSGPPPAPPALSPLAPPQNGLVTIQGTAASGARVDVTNLTLGITTSTFAGPGGTFSVLIDANVGDAIRAVTVDPAQSTQPSAPAQATVPAPPALVRIEVAPSTFTLTALNAFRDLAVTAFYDNGSSADVTGQATYASSHPAVASANGAGRVVALASGQATITAAFGGQQAQATATVTIRTLLSIALDPAAFTLAGVGATRQLAVIGSYSDGTTSPITSGVVFTTSAPAVVLVSTGGLVTATGLGQSTIGATVSGLPTGAQSTATVAAATVTGIDVSPNTILFTQVGESRQLQVSRTLSTGATEPAPAPITYQSSDAGVATVSATGLVTAVATGDATITVGHAGFEATVAVTVDIPVVTSPPEITALDRPRAAEGDPFTIRGRHFAAVPAQNLVRVNGVQAQVQSARQDELTVVVPAGATTGPVTVQVGAFTSNEVPLTVYARLARSLELTGGVDVAAAPGQTLTLVLAGIEVRPGDVALLSSAPDTPVPLGFAGTLTGQVDAGAPFVIPPSTTDVIDLTSRLAPGVHSLTLELAESGGRIRTGPIHLLVGPDDTGPIAGDRYVVGLNQSRPVPVTITGLPYPDGSKVAVTALQIGVDNPQGTGNVPSAGGSIVNGEGASPNDPNRFVFFTVRGGRIDVLYDPATLGFATGTGGVANVQVLPADAAGSRIGFQAVVVEPVVLTTFDTAAAPRTQASVVADGNPKLVTITLTGIRDTAGNLVPDGARVAVTALQIGVDNPEGTGNVFSAGGSIVNGAGASPNDPNRFVFFTVAGGRVDIQYSPGAVQLPVGDVRVANIQVLPADAAGSRIGFRAFTVVPVTLSSPTANAVNVGVAPPSALSDGADNRVTVTVTGITDVQGHPVPDGTRVAVTVLQIGVDNPEGTGNVASAGGSLPTALGASPNDPNRFRFYEVHGGQVQIVYSTAGAATTGTRVAATAVVQILPAAPDGSRIGFRAFAVAPITLTGYQTAESTAVPASAVADGLQKIVAVTLTGIRDTAGNLVPDGSRVAVTTLQIGVDSPEGTGNVFSASGSIVNGEGASPNDPNRFVFFTVTGGRVDIQYSPVPVLLAVGDVQTARVQVLPAAPSGSYIHFRAFAVVPITLSSPTAPAVNVSVDPVSVLADGADNRSTVTVTGITDVLGNPVPDGTRVAATVLEIGVNNPEGTGNVASAGGSLPTALGASPNDPNRFRFYEVQGGRTTIVYSAQGGPALGARQSATARVQVLPAEPNGSRIGFRAFAVGPITLAGYQTADVAGPGALAPGATGTYVVSNIVDTSGQPVPNGSRIAVTTQQIGVDNPDGTGNVASIGGTLLNAAGAPPNDPNRFGYYTVQNGQISIQYQAPAGAGTATLQLLPADPGGNRLGFRAFAVKAIQVGP